MNRAITISGLSGSGKSTLAKKISEYTGLRYISVGNIYRASCSLKELEDNKKIEKWDYKLDSLIQEGILNGELVIEGRTVGYIGNNLKKEGVEGITNLYLSCVPQVRLNRIIKRDKGSEKTLERDYRDVERFFKKYGVNIENSGLYDAVIDSSKTSEEYVFSLAKEEIEKYWRK
ncbi:MAG: AAA family ATPase [Nanoarchaeota archaeon]|nr:AAA family ATPase [Nanoarchaeota archaeon]MCG2718962.1 AAA family ATPase [Nanoarchaeota archaeon]